MRCKRGTRKEHKRNQDLTLLVIAQQSMVAESARANEGDICLLN